MIKKKKKQKDLDIELPPIPDPLDDVKDKQVDRDWSRNVELPKSPIDDDVR